MSGKRRSSWRETRDKRVTAEAVAKGVGEALGQAFRPDYAPPPDWDKLLDELP